MDDFISKVFIFLRIPLIILGPILIVRLFYRLFFKKEQEKIRKLKDAIEQQETWSTPLFNNAGFVLGIFLFLLGPVGIIFKVSDPNYGFPIIGSVFLGFSGLFMVWGAPFIRIKKESIVFQPLLFKLLSLKISEKIIYYNDILKVTKTSYYPPFIMLIIHTKQGKKFKLNISLNYNSEVGNAIYEILQRKSQI